MSESLLKKEFKKSDVNRIRNLVNKDFSSSVKTGIGYSKKEEEHEEGEVWEENERFWTIKNGIKQNVTKLDKVKDMVRIPLSCPKCGGPMNNLLHKKMYKIHGFCFDCTIDYENSLRIAGLYKEYERKMVQGNIKSFLKDLEEWTKSFISESSTYVTEQGEIEDWNGMNPKQKTKIMGNLLEYKKIIQNHLK